jgi:putative flippase GtrA
MKTFLKAQTSSLVATVIDFLITIGCVEFALIPVVISGAIGNASGAVINFRMGQKWVFDPSESSAAIQALRYGVVWSGYLILNATGMMVMERFTPIHYVLSKIIVGVTLAVTYNYFLQKKFVFN